MVHFHYGRNCRSRAFAGKWKKGNSTVAPAMRNLRQRGGGVRGAPLGNTQAPVPMRGPALVAPPLPGSGSTLAGRDIASASYPYTGRGGAGGALRKLGNFCRDWRKNDKNKSFHVFPLSNIWTFLNHQFPIYRKKVVKEVCLDLIKIHCVFTRQWLFLEEDWKSDLSLLFNSFTEDETPGNNSWAYHSDGVWGHW